MLDVGSRGVRTSRKGQNRIDENNLNTRDTAGIGGADRTPISINPGIAGFGPGVFLRRDETPFAEEKTGALRRQTSGRRWIGRLGSEYDLLALVARSFG